MPQASNSLEVVRVDAWEHYPWLRHGFSTRLGGVSSVYGGNALNLGWTKEDDAASVKENRKRFLQAASEPSRSTVSFTLVGVRQIHSAIIREVRESDCAPEGKLATSEGRPALEGDGLITGLPGIMIAVGAADCVPVLVVDTRKRIAAAFHAGWRGTALRIVESSIERLRQTFGSRAEDLVAAIGPSIGPCCYAVGGEVQTDFSAKFRYANQLFHRHDPLHSTMHLDLWEANRRQLLDAGLPKAQITVLAACTACSRDAHGRLKYFSHRSERGVTGRMLAAVGIAPDTNPGRSVTAV